ncbi:hypothetical protein B0H19DRAFT_1271372 [Mycena capillaripes]|nr:hypothetical protein B0H19DRAFT_1271372 [Mycena capillaripes]
MKIHKKTVRLRDLRSTGMWLAQYSADWIRYISVVAPSPDFIPLIRLVNPDFVLSNYVDSDGMDEFLRWLKQIYPVPEDSIRRWDDYGFINSYEHIQHQITDNLFEKRDDWCPERTAHQVCAAPLRTLLNLQSWMYRGLWTALASFWKLLAQSPRLFRIFQTRLVIPHRGHMRKRTTIICHGKMFGCLFVLYADL